MKIHLSAVLSVILLSAVLSSPAFAARHGFTKHTKATPTPHHETVVTSVTPTSVVITEDKAARTFTINQFTEVTLNGQKATITDLKPGMKVSVTLGADPTQLSRIAASTSK